MTLCRLDRSLQKLVRYCYRYAIDCAVWMEKVLLLKFAVFVTFFMSALPAFLVLPYFYHLHKMNGKITQANVHLIASPLDPVQVGQKFCRYRYRYAIDCAVCMEKLLLLKFFYVCAAYFSGLAFTIYIRRCMVK